MSDTPTAVAIRYNPDHTGTFTVPDDALETPIWSRLKLAIRTKKLDHTVAGGAINLSWPDTLGVVRELGSKANQISLNFRFRPEGEAEGKLRAFAAQIRKTRELRSQITEVLTTDEIEARLKDMGFTKRELRDFQLRDLSHLLALSNGANFSVPGAGKTTVTFALHMLTRQPGHHFIVVAPKAAFQAGWTLLMSAWLKMPQTAALNLSRSWSVLRMKPAKRFGRGRRASSCPMTW